MKLTTIMIRRCRVKTNECVTFYSIRGKTSLWKGYSIEKHVKSKVDEINLKTRLAKIKLLN